MKNSIQRILLGWWVSMIGMGFAQNVQWASRVVAFSSQFTTKQYGSNQVLGKPNVLPAFRDSPCAWSPLKQENTETEFIEVAFPEKRPICQVAIAESQNPGAISKVILYEESGSQHTVYHNEHPGQLSVKGRMLHVKFGMTSYNVAKVRVELQTAGWPGWKHVDAIGTSNLGTEIQAEVHYTESLVFPAPSENLGTAINSIHDEIMPVISPDGNLLYFDRKDHPGNTGGTINDDIWFSEMGPGGKWMPAVNVGEPLNNSGHNFLTAISPDGNTALLGNVYENDGTMSAGLSISYRGGEGWQFPIPLYIKNYYNNNKFSEFYLGADGRTILLTVERSDTYGGKDLYVSFRMEDGTGWTEPKNLGPVVNSAATEMSPFLAADGKTLYFSSDGFSGFGGKDMFVTRRLDETWTNWTEPENLGPKINSSGWDAYYSLPASGEFAYFSSEKGSMGKTDIFRIKLPKELRPDAVVLVKGRVIDSKSRKPVQAKIRIETLPDGVEVGTALSSAETGEFQIALPAGKRYGFLAQAEKYLSINQSIDLTEVKEYEERNQDLELVPILVGETVVLNNIFFTPSEAKVLPESYPELNRMAGFLKSNPSIKIEISGHTNNACTEAFCLKLSTERAKSVYDYLASKGVPAAQMKYIGYGASKPKASNDTPEGQRANRRVEFTILGL